jgi:hypothetical protein
MRKVVFTFGLIGGLIVSALMFGSMPLWKNGIIDFNDSQWIGYTSIVISLSVIFFGVKSYRDAHLNGDITFGRAMGVGVLITLIASVVYAVGWEFCFHFFYPNFMEEYTAICIDRAKASGVTGAELADTIARFDQAREMYKNPLLRFGFTMMEPLPVGILISLISGALLRKKSFLAAQHV